MSGIRVWEYEAAAHRTISPECRADMDKALLNAVLGLVGEAGEVADHVKKHLFHGHEIDLTHLAKEAGDIMWYIAELCFAISYTMPEVADMNIEKLLKRYPDGFSSERSLSRLDMVEVDVGTTSRSESFVSCGAEINLNMRNHVCGLNDGHEGDHQCAGVGSCNTTWPREDISPLMEDARVGMPPQTELDAAVAGIPKCINCGYALDQHDPKNGYCHHGGHGEDATSYEPMTEEMEQRLQVERTRNEEVDLLGFDSSLEGTFDKPPAARNLNPASPQCRQAKPNSLVVCTRPKGHEGRHQGWLHGPEAWEQ